MVRAEVQFLKKSKAARLLSHASEESGNGQSQKILKAVKGEDR